ncbi:DUF2752 domain-containing protein [Flavobacterium agricola]|uniref:DUF2752 domain-containing protein n=1 Tax=Flavobacterium agricola TaxID=2870839 RepID=A0ABY6M272_9FLAO|nr:DUF2752 domain-containing protein [Flavobacterium agricola]
MKKQTRILLKFSSTLLVFGAFLFIYFFYNPTMQGVPFPKCPSYSFFGLVCPGCGTQRAIHALLHLHLQEAFLYNPLLIICFPFLAYMFGLYLYNFIFEKKKQIQLLYSPFFSKCLLVVICLYFVLRNLPFLSLTFLNPNN